ncbi:MAG: DUF47 family protein [bacterium]
MMGKNIKIIKSIFPGSEDFYARLHECSLILVELCKEIANLFDDPTEEKYEKIVELENKADKILVEYRKRLNEVFITPLDREDLHRIIVYLDEVIDYAKSAAEKKYLYKPKQKVEFFYQMIDIMIQISEKIMKIIEMMKNPSNHMHDVVNQIYQLEKQADSINRRGIIWLFENSLDPTELIKNKDILFQLEETIDRMQRLAVTVENSVFKNL